MHKTFTIHWLLCIEVGGLSKNEKGPGDMENSVVIIVGEREV